MTAYATPGARKRGENPTYKLTPQDRYIVALMVGMDLWPKAQIAKVFGVSPKAVYKCAQDYGMLP